MFHVNVSEASIKDVKENSKVVSSNTKKPVKHEAKTAFSTSINPKLVSENKISKNNSRNSGVKSSNDLSCLADNIYFEAGGESRKGKIAIANVTLKRVSSGKYGKSVCGVVYSRNNRSCAFSWTCDKRSNIPHRGLSYAESKEIALLALLGELDDVTGGAEFYHERHVKPKWCRRMRITVMIGGHIFYNVTRKA
jgi:spore germination cell wall hydrolase CwlJ-like protein